MAPPRDRYRPVRGELVERLARPAVFIAEERPVCLHSNLSVYLTVRGPAPPRETCETCARAFCLRAHRASGVPPTIAHAAASERDAGNAAIHHAAMPRPAGERGGGIASANHADAWRPTSQRSQPASFRKNSH